MALALDAARALDVTQCISATEEGAPARHLTKVAATRKCTVTNNFQTWTPHTDPPSPFLFLDVESHPLPHCFQKPVSERSRGQPMLANTGAAQVSAR